MSHSSSMSVLRPLPRSEEVIPTSGWATVFTLLHCECKCMCVSQVSSEHATGWLHLTVHHWPSRHVSVLGLKMGRWDIVQCPQKNRTFC